MNHSHEQVPEAVYALLLSFVLYAIPPPERVIRPDDFFVHLKWIHYYGQSQRHHLR